MRSVCFSNPLDTAMKSSQPPYQRTIKAIKCPKSFKT